MPATPIYFLRHGQTDWNVAALLQGQTDTSINDTGRAQARTNAARLAEALAAAGHDPHDFDYVASPLWRACETMEIVRRGLGLEAAGYRTDKRLMEIAFGAWEGRSFPQIKIDDPQAHRRRRADKWSYQPPGGESYAMLSERVRAWFVEIARPSIVVAHGGVSRVLRGHIDGLSPAETMLLDVPQDRVLAIGSDGYSWI